MKQIINILKVVFVLVCANTFGQIEKYNYKREITGIAEQWHRINLPDSLFAKVSQSLTDLRVYGITPGNDTIEAPYLLRLSTGKTDSKKVDFKRLNTSRNNKGHFITFEIPGNESVNQITLDFEQPNFDWKIDLQGSHNQTEWYTVLEDYRILSIKNELTNYQFTKLTFPDSKYQFYRLNVKTAEKADLKVASIVQHETTEGTFNKYPISIFTSNINKQAKQTEIEVALPLKVPVSRISIRVSNSVDYYRPVVIKYLSDSTKTERGWKYNYSTLASGILNSIEQNDFYCSSTIAQKFRIIIQNQDNLPLNVNAVEIDGYAHEMAVRFTEPAQYFLTYNSNFASKPKYDIERFPDNVPEVLTTVKLGAEQIIEKEQKPVNEPLFENKTWLWGVMVVIILLLGWFSVKMMRKV